MSAEGAEEGIRDTIGMERHSQRHAAALSALTRRLAYPALRFAPPQAIISSALRASRCRQVTPPSRPRPLILLFRSEVGSIPFVSLSEVNQLADHVPSTRLAAASSLLVHRDFGDR